MAAAGTQVNLTSQEGETFEIDAKMAMLSEVVKSMLENDGKKSIEAV